MKIKCFEKWSKFQHGSVYWLGAVQVASHCLNQCWHSSSTHIYTSVSVTESSIMSLYDRTITETDMSSRWRPGLSLGALKLAFSASGDGWGGHPGDISVSSKKSLCIHIYLIQCLTHCGQDKMATFFADDNFKCIFLNGNSWITNEISLKYVA